MRILVTGGAGYIGSHAALRLLDDGHEVTIVDNLSRGHLGAIEVIATIGGPRLSWHRIDLGDTAALTEVLRAHDIELVMHFAALAYVGESVTEPLRYYETNVAGSISLLKAMHGASVRRLVFSSTCATYGAPEPSCIPIDEGCPQAPINPYGRTKLIVEQMLRDQVEATRRGGDAGNALGVVALRYFNVAGADQKGRIGEDHRPETHLVPICLEAAAGRRDHVAILGTDYDTPDGTCVRDYVHVEDLVDAHLRAMGAVRPGAWQAWNVGIGRGYSVREVIEACRRVTGREIRTIESPRRAGDPPVLFADSSRLRRDLGWEPRHASIEAIVESTWRWMTAHPEGYSANDDRGG